MAAELEKLAAELQARGYSTGAHLLRGQAEQWRQAGHIPDALGEQQQQERTPRELATRIYSFASRLERTPFEDFDTLEVGDKSIAIWSDRPYGYMNNITLHSSDNWFPDELGSGGISFEANIKKWRRDEIHTLGVYPEHVIAVGHHTEDRSRERALQLIQEGNDRFETDYFFDQEGNVVKLSLMPIELDGRPDVFNQPIRDLGMKRIVTDMTPRDVRLIDKTLSIFETALPRTYLSMD
jgi:hypothetical protein